MEEWRKIEGYPYEVSSEGRVRRVGARVCRKLHIANGGRPYTSLWRNNKQNTFRIHILVAAAFIGPRPNGMMVLHGDGDPTNNRATNLRYGTGSDNMQDAIEHGTFRRGAASTEAAFTWDQIDIIRSAPRTRGYQTQLAKRFGATQSAISLVINNKTYKDEFRPISSL